MDPRPALAAVYDAHVDDRERRGEPAWLAPFRADFADRLPAGARLLELGSGVGYTARWFADRGVDVVASDLSPANVRKCREKGLRAEVVDMSELPFADRSFDAIWAFSCLMHIPGADLERTLRSIARVLVEGGLCWAGTWGDPVESEGPWENDWYEPKRFYAIRSDETMRSAYESVFDVVSFRAADPEPAFDWHYQIALLRRRAATS